MNIAFYVSGKGTRLKKIFRDNRFTTIKKHVKLVFTDNFLNDDLSEIKNNNQVEIKGIQYENIEGTIRFKNHYLSEILLEKFNNSKIDYCFCFGDHILTSELLDHYKYKIINFHPSLLPMFPGRRSIDKAVENNSFLMGNTAHFIDEGIDTGPIIMQNVIHSSIFEKNKDYDEILDIQIDMFYQIFDWLNEDRIQIKNNKCVIKNSSFEKAVFYPRIENGGKR